MKQMYNELLTTGDMNILTIDWYLRGLECLGQFVF